MKTFVSALLFLLAAYCAYSQNVAINNDGTSPHASAILDVKSTTKGMLIPRMTMAQRNAISTPAAGLMIFQTDNGPGMYLYNGSAWYNVTTASAGWSLSGNSGTNPATHFIGTADNQPLRFRLNNVWAGEMNAGTSNIFLGDSSGYTTTNGTQNTSLGSKSLKLNSTGLGNTAIGSYALNHTEVSYATAVGSHALFSNTYGVSNSAVGYSALWKNTIGSYNTAVGFEASRQNLIGYDNTSVGYQALYWNTSSYNTAVGTSCLAFNTTGTNNTALGMNALYSNTTGHENTAIGRDALLSSTTALENTSIGYQSMASALWGSWNTAIGAWALNYNVNGNYNTAVGYRALFHNQEFNNTAIGWAAMEDNETGFWNVAVGALALEKNTNGLYNTALGAGALRENVTGDGNVAVGEEAGTNSSYSNTIGLGNSGYLINANQKVYIGNAGISWIGGQVGWSTYSDLRIKSNIREDVPGIDFINRLRPVTYYKDIDLQLQLTGNKPMVRNEYSHDIEQIKFSGFLAQEVEQAAKASGYDFSGITVPKNEHDLYTLSYESFVVPLVKAVQEQQVMIESARQKEESLQTRILEQQQKLVSLEARLMEIEQRVAQVQREKDQ